MSMRSMLRFFGARKASGRRLADFRHDASGATAVEFGLVALPFLALLFAILETSLIFFAGQTLETAVVNTARLIRTGQAQQLGYGVTNIRTSICSQVITLANCAGNLQLDVRTYATFSSINLAKPLNAQGNLDTSNFTYAAGHGGDIVVVRAFFEWPVWSKLLGLGFGNLTNGNHLLSATAAFRNEPFPW